MGMSAPDLILPTPPSSPHEAGITVGRVVFLYGRFVLRMAVPLLLALLLLAWWGAIPAWYVVMFSFFGLLLSLFRAFQRSDRKERTERPRHR